MGLTKIQMTPTTSLQSIWWHRQCFFLYQVHHHTTDLQQCMCHYEISCTILLQFNNAPAHHLCPLHNIYYLCSTISISKIFSHYSSIKHLTQTEVESILYRTNLLLLPHVSLLYGNDAVGGYEQKYYREWILWFHDNFYFESGVGVGLRQQHYSMMSQVSTKMDDCGYNIRKWAQTYVNRTMAQSGLIWHRVY